MDTLTPQERSERMSRVRSQDTKPEMIVRRLVHSMGFRYRLHRKDLPGKPDLVFPRLQKAIFVHGCFWHLHPDSGCPFARLPKSRLDFWLPKLEANRARDIKTVETLSKTGWSVLTVWECQLKDKTELQKRIRGFLG